jgi:crotonobetainyl-CoA:carnitine CoA-transferase CaiB-like acyl-CoA transferase
VVEWTRFRLVPQAVVSLRSKVLQLGRSSRQLPVADNVVGWLGTTGILAALRRRAIEGGSYRVVVSLTRTVLWLLSLGIFEEAYGKSTAGSTEEHTEIASDLFTAETPLGTYQGMTDQVIMSRTPGAFRTVLLPRGSSKPEWLPVSKSALIYSMSLPAPLC